MILREAGSRCRVAVRSVADSHAMNLREGDVFGGMGMRGVCYGEGVDLRKAGACRAVTVAGVLDRHVNA